MQQTNVQKITDEAFESPFLGIESKIQNALGENKDAKLEQVKDAQQLDEAQLYESFVKEKSSILNYVRDLIIYAAKLNGIDSNQLLNEEIKEDHIKIKTEYDSHLSTHRVNLILEKYQEQSSMLDPLIEQFVAPIMAFLQIYVRKAVAEQKYGVPAEVKNLFLLLTQMCKVRGYKTIVKFFPHEVSDLEQVTEMLHFQDETVWEIPYILVLWLSIIVLVPFDLTTIDSQKNHELLVKRIMNIGQLFSENSGKLRDGSAILLSKLITRPDVVKSGETDRFLKAAAESYLLVMDDARNKPFAAAGILQTLVEVFKTGHRDDLLSRVGIVFDAVLKSEQKSEFMKKSTILMKARVNLAQRIGCIFLKPKVAKWRYQRGHRSLTQNLASSGVAAQIISSHSVVKPQNQNTEMKNEEEESDEDLEDEQYEKLEFIIQYLLDALKDDDNVVRWTAAKGIGRITMRLPQEYADQIVEQLSDLFGKSTTDSAWHGGCLALAELCRRGLLLPQRLTSFVPVLEQALVYDINLGNHSVGAHVRDAACYVVWSFARAYSPDIMKPHVKTLANQLVNISLFDREVNCRRAASATFQEAVGRQGTFPHGIEILTEADYFTLSNRVNAYLNVSCFVGQFEEYLESMLNYLAFVQLRHWEPAMRQLAAQSLAVLSVFNPTLVVGKILPKLIESCFSKALVVRHGSIIGVSEIIIGLSGNSVVHRQQVLEKAFKTLSLKERNLIKEETDNQKQFTALYDQISGKNALNESLPIGSEIRISVKTLLSRIEAAKLLKGKGGDVMRQGVCHLIHSLSQAQVEFEKAELQQFFETIKEYLRHPNQEIQEDATKALQSFCDSYFAEDQLPADRIWLIDEIKRLYKPSGFDASISVTKGYNMALGALSGRLYRELNVELIETLLKNCLPKGKDQDDAETRKQAIKSLISVVQTLGIDKIDREQLCDIMETFYKALNDYTLDRRGDVGSWVREETMVALTTFVSTMILDREKHEAALEVVGATKPAFFERYVSALLQQLAEKIDRVREVAGRQLQIFFKHCSGKVCQFEERDQLTALFTQEQTDYAQDGGAIETHIHDEGIGYLPWRSADFVFEQIKPFFDSPTYSLSVLRGLVTSSGGLTESTLKASSKTLFLYLSAMKDKNDQKSAFLQKLTTVFEENMKDDRITVPLMKTCEMLLQSDYLQENDLAPDLIKIHGLCVNECNKSKNIVKLMASIGVFSNMLAYNNNELVVKALRSLLFLLYHSFPKVRATSAEKLYTSLLTMEEFDMLVPGGEEDYDAACDMLSETDWALPAKTLKESTQSKFYAFFGQEVKTQQPTEDKTGDTKMIQT